MVEEMLKQLLNGKVSKEKVQQALEEVHVHDLVESLESLSNEERSFLYTFLDNEKLAEIVAYLEPEDAALLLADFDLVKQKAIFDEVDVDDAVDILQAYENESVRDQLIDTLSEEENIKAFIKYDENSVGAYMNNDFITFSPNHDVKEAVRILIKEAPLVETINTLFVVDEQYIFLGAINFKKLVKARSPMLVSALMNTVPTVLDESPITQAIHDMKNYEVFELPVVNKENELLGILTLDDALDIALVEAEEDYQRFAALPVREETRSIFKTAFYRLPWLAILMALTLPIITFTNMMTGAVGGIAILVFFQPLMLDSAGNVSTQTLAIALKSIATEGKMNKREVVKEIFSGLITALMLGIIAFIGSFIFVYLGKQYVGSSFIRVEYALIFASIIGGSLLFVIAISPLLAIGVPHLIKAIRLDPSVASGPFITTIIDLFSAFVYFGLATLILKGVGII